MKKGTYIITGATGGIGRAITEEVLRQDDTEVILAVRNTKQAEMIKKGYTYETRIKILELDLANLNSVVRFASKILSSGTNISGLFNNAGTMPGEMNETSDGLEMATQVNFVATALLTELLLPSVISDGGIVFTTSMTRRIARLKENWDYISKESHHRFVTYGRSKLMLTHYAYDLSQRLEGRVRVNCSDPWIVNSKIIKMGNRIVDKISHNIAPLIFRSPLQGAIPALRAMEAEISGQIFTLNGHKPIPEKYARAKGHNLPKEIIKEWREKIGGCTKKS